MGLIIGLENLLLINLRAFLVFFCHGVPHLESWQCGSLQSSRPATAVSITILGAIVDGVQHVVLV